MKPKKKIEYIFFCFLVVSFFLNNATYAQETYQPVKFDGTYSMEFYPSSTDDFDDEGTIELIFKAEPIPKTPNKGFLGIIGTNKSESDASTTDKNESNEIGTYAIFSQADDWGTRFVIYLNRSLNRIGLYDGKRFESVPFNFNDGAFHHVAFSESLKITPSKN